MINAQRRIDFRIETLTEAQVQHWLTKTARSISGCRGPSDLSENYRKNMLVVRYDELKERAKVLKVWDIFCDKLGFSRDHDGFDCAA